MRDEETGRLRLLFVCTGNTCRSPLAEALARRLARERGIEAAEARSAGTFAGSGDPPSRGSVLVARRHGLDLSGHRSEPLAPEHAEWADLVLAMAESHRRVAEDVGGEGKTHLLTEFLPADHPSHGKAVADPAGQSVEAYEEAYRLIEAATAALFTELAEE